MKFHDDNQNNTQYVRIHNKMPRKMQTKVHGISGYGNRCSLRAEQKDVTEIEVWVPERRIHVNYKKKEDTL